MEADDQALFPILVAIARLVAKADAHRAHGSYKPT